MANGLWDKVKQFYTFFMHGYKFQTKSTKRNRKSQHSGVVTRAAMELGGRDIVIDFYGVITDMFDLDYGPNRSVTLFKCDWFDVTKEGTGIMRDEKLGITLVNFEKLFKTDEKFVFANQVEQVFYVQDPVQTNWHAVVRTKPRNLFDMPTDTLEYGQVIWFMLVMALT